MKLLARVTVHALALVGLTALLLEAKDEWTARKQRITEQLANARPVKRI